MSWFKANENLAILKLMIIMTLILGGVYPLILTGLGHAFFPFQAQGSLIKINQQVVGSVHLGQEFQSPQYFKSRPSLTHYQNDELTPQSILLWGTPALSEFVSLARQQWPQVSFIPSDMLYPSASMLDPHISWMGVVIQLASVARARNMDINDLYRFVEAYGRTKEIINVLELNLALDKEFSHS